MGFPCRVSIVISGNDPQRSESVTDNFYLANASSIDDAINVMRDYADWRATFLGAALYITGLRAAREKVFRQPPPRMSDSIPVLIPSGMSATIADNLRDLLSTGYRFANVNEDGTRRTTRTMRALPDGYVEYTDDGQEAALGARTALETAFSAKAKALKLCMRCNSRDPATTKPFLIEDCHIDQGYFRWIDVPAMVAAGQTFQPGDQVQITGCQGIGGGRLNGNYRVGARADSDPNYRFYLSVPKYTGGVVYAKNTGTSRFIIPQYIAIDHVEFERFDTRRPAKNSTGGGGHPKKV
jgi:hypothetical protein